MIVGYHAPHEQYAPAELLGHLRAADAAGFRAAMCSDHLAPFIPQQGHSGHAWTWLGAALEATRPGGMSLGVVSAPGYRYHPAVLAQAAATCAQMAPGRFWVALGSGEPLNEHVTGERWPEKRDRDERLRECAEAMRRLLLGEEVTHRGRVTIDRARLWSLPPVPPPLYGAALTAKTAAEVAGWADGLITVPRPTRELEEIVHAFRSAGGEGKPLLLQAQVSWAPTEKEALAAAHREWRACVLPPEALGTIETPEDFERACQSVRPEDVARCVHVTDDLSSLSGPLRTWERLGFSAVYLHNVGRDQRGFIREAAHHLPGLVAGRLQEVADGETEGEAEVDATA
jgi:coenzyme F420-dependent glucose-6-phosphate dehydrogenase